MPDIKIDKLSKEVLKKYTIKNDAFVQIAKNNPNDLIVCEIGDTKDATKFQNQMKICRWGNTSEDNEANISLRLIENETGVAEVLTDKDKIIWKKGNIETHYYDVLDGEGGKEMEVVFLSKPISNVVQVSVVTKDADFLYQPALTQTEKDEGSIRPENVEGSYAIYAKTPKINYVGGKEYRTGKIGHIFRPKIIDSAGKEVWGELKIDKGILSVTIPQDFLDKANYPVKHASGLTFGYMTAGATSIVRISTNVDYCLVNSSYLLTAATGDTVAEINIYASNGGGGSGTLGTSLYTFSGGVPVTRLLAEQTVTVNGAAQWWQVAGLSTAMSNGVQYAIAYGNWAKGTATNLTVYYDSGAAGSQSYQAAGALPATWSQTATQAILNSVYVTYRNATAGTYTDVYGSAGTFNWICPTGVSAIAVECWGGGGNGKAYTSPNNYPGGGGGGGAYAKSTGVAVTAGNSYPIVVGGVAADTKFNTTTVIAKGGASATNTGGALGGTAAASTGDTKYGGGNGGGTTANPGTGSGGGGGAGGTDGTGNNGANGTATDGGAGGSGDAGSGGSAGSAGNNGIGGNGGFSVKGGGGGGGGDGTYGGGNGGGYGGGGGGGDMDKVAGTGAAGGCIITYVIAGASAIKTINGLAKASIKTFNGVAVASVKSINGLTL